MEEQPQVGAARLIAIVTAWPARRWSIFWKDFLYYLAAPEYYGVSRCRALDALLRGESSQGTSLIVPWLGDVKMGLNCVWDVATSHRRSSNSLASRSEVGIGLQGMSVSHDASAAASLLLLMHPPH